VIAVDFGCCHDPSAPWPTFAQSERTENIGHSGRHDSVSELRSAEIRRGIGKRRERGVHWAPFEARGWKRSGPGDRQRQRQGNDDVV